MSRSNIVVSVAVTGTTVAGRCASLQPADSVRGRGHSSASPRVRATVITLSHLPSLYISIVNRLYLTDCESSTFYHTIIFIIANFL